MGLEEPAGQARACVPKYMIWSPAGDRGHGSGSRCISEHAP